jgi:DNA relaxase NicK
MRTHIDWLTFTMGMAYADETDEAYANAIRYGFEDMFGKELLADAFGGNWTKNERSRAPYTDSWKLGDDGITLFASPNLNHCCVEISGQGCENLIEASLLADVLSCAKERITRIDIASDIETMVKPAEFVEKVNHERMRTSGHVLSDTGETCYVGSQKSDRYARVYRYSEPHPRAHLLRIEHVFRREYAKVVAAQITQSDIESVAKSAGNAFGWAHPVWNVTAAQEVDLSVVKAEPTMGGTVFWLIKSVAPAFKKLVEKGIITDQQKFFDDYFKTDGSPYA